MTLPQPAWSYLNTLSCYQCGRRIRNDDGLSCTMCENNVCSSVKCVELQHEKECWGVDDEVALVEQDMVDYMEFVSNNG